MFVFKDINKTSTVVEQNVVNYTQNLSASADGINSIKIVSGSSNTKYWDSLNVLFYTSGSPVYNKDEAKRFASPSSNFLIQKIGGKQFSTKFHGYPSSSILTIPQQYFGEKIKEKSFKFTDLSNTDNGGNNPIIKDDGNGNLYSTNAHHSQSVGALSSSDNYVGNIFYDKGLAVITETGSWSGSVDYSDLATNFNLQFDSYNTIVTYEYTITIQPDEYNGSMNYTLRSPISGSLKESTTTISKDFTSSVFSPYITTINLYGNASGMGVMDGDDLTKPIIQAKLPRPIKKSKKVATTFKIRLDI